MKATIYFEIDYDWDRLREALRAYERSESKAQRKEKPDTYAWSKEREYQRTLAEQVVEVLQRAMIATDPKDGEQA